MVRRLEDLPEGTRIVIEAKGRAWRGLTDAQREEAVAHAKRQRIAAKARQQATEAAYRTIVSMVLSGAAPEAAAAIAARTRASAYSLLDRLGIPVGAPTRARRVPQVFLTDQTMDALDDFAIDGGQDLPTAIGALLSACAADGGHIARRLFGLKKRDADASPRG